LIAPSCECPTGACFVEPEKSYKIARHGELFPYDLDLQEQGPPGWEHIVAIVSDTPLVEDTLYGAGNK
jgi:hypothetical protein